MGGLIPAALMDLNTLIIITITIFIIAIMISFVVAIVLGPLIIAIAISVMKGPIRPGFMTNMWHRTTQNVRLVLHHGQSFGQIFLDKPNIEFIYTTFV